MSFVRIAKNRTKLGAANALYATGLLERVIRRRLKDQALVLMYHRVLPNEVARQSFSHSGLIVSPATFQRHMEFVKRRLHPLSLKEFMACMESGAAFPAGACLVTFDDGWSDNYDHALPVLRALEVPAVVFVATDYIGADRPFWQEYLGHLLYEAARRGLASEVRQAFQIDLPVGTDDARLREGVAATVDRFRAESYDVIESLLRALERSLAEAGGEPIHPPPDRFMAWEQVRAMHDSGVDIASHTRSHRALTRLDAGVIDEELASSRRILVDALGADVPAFAYPGGFYDDRSRQAAIDSGYRLAFATDAGTVGANDDRWRIPRVNMHESATRTLPLFLARLAGLL